MSHQATTWVMEFSKSRLADRLVLLAIAHRVSNDNGEAFPSIARIVRETLLSERQVYTSVASLCALGELEVLEEPSQYGTNRYRMPLCMEWLQNMHPAKCAGVQNEQRKQAKGVQNIQETPAQNADEPSFKPSVEENHQDTPVSLAFPKPEKRKKAKSAFRRSSPSIDELPPRQERPIGTDAHPSYVDARTAFKEITGVTPGSLTDRLAKEWNSLVSANGEEVVIHALKAYANSILPRIGRMKYPIYGFLHDSAGWIAEARVSGPESLDGAEPEALAKMPSGGPRLPKEYQL